MQLECIAHWEEVYIRSYPLADTSAYARKLVDLPVTLRLEGEDFFLSYRRGLEGGWKVFSSDIQLRQVRAHLQKFMAKVRPNADLETVVADVFQEVSNYCAKALQEKPVELTRRDALVSLIREEKANLLLHTNPNHEGICVAYYHLGGVCLVALSCRATSADSESFEVIDVVEPTLLDWKLLCETLKADPTLSRSEMDSVVHRFFNALCQSSAVHVRTPAHNNQPTLQALEC